MRRKRTTPATESAVTTLAPLPHVVLPHAVYSSPAFRAAFGLRESTARREIREGRLRVAKRGGRYYLLGEWILEWLRGGEIRRRTAERNGQDVDPSTTAL